MVEHRFWEPEVGGSRPSSLTILQLFYGVKMHKQYECEVCGHIHDEEFMGKFEDLPKYANCPECGSDAREVYKLIEF